MLVDRHLINVLQSAVNPPGLLIDLPLVSSRNTHICMGDPNVRPGLYIHTAAAQAAVSFRNFGFSPIWAFAPIPQTDAPHIIAAAQIFFDQTGSAEAML